MCRHPVLTEPLPYLVGDPLSKIGFVPRTRAQLETYFATARLGGLAIEVRR